MIKPLTEEEATNLMLYKRICSPWLRSSENDRYFGESTLWYLQSRESFFTGYSRGTIEWSVQEVKGLGFGTLNFRGSCLYHCIQYFSIVKETRSRLMDVGILWN
jgi:hypothetical protein